MHLNGPKRTQYKHSQESQFSDLVDLGFLHPSGQKSARVTLNLFIRF